MAVDGEVHDDDADGMWMVTKSLDAEIKKSCMLHAKEYVQSVNDIVQHLPRHASPQVSVLEVGSQHGHLQEILRQRGEMHEYMSDRGVDVSRSRDVATALQVLDDVKPHWLWLSPVCETEHPTGRSEKALIQCRRRWKQAAETCIALAQAQIDAGRHVVWEWPVETKFWSRGDVRAFMKRLKQSGQIFEARVHACQVEDRGSDDMPRSSRSWRLWSTSKSLAQVLHSVCDGGHQHQSLTCLLQRMPGNLPHATCRRVVQEMKLQFELQRAEDEQVCADHDRAFEVANQSFPDICAVQELGDPEKLTKEEKIIHAQLMKLHRRCGHPGNRALVNLLKTREVDDHVIRIAQHLRCDECQKLKVSEPRNVVGLDRCEQLWHTLQIDHFDFNWNQEVIHVLVMTDEASQYTHCAGDASQTPRGIPKLHYSRGNSSSGDILGDAPRVPEPHSIRSRGSFQGHGSWCLGCRVWD